MLLLSTYLLLSQPWCHNNKLKDGFVLFLIYMSPCCSGWYLESSLWPLNGTPILPIVFIASIIDNENFLFWTTCFTFDLLSCCSSGFFFPETCFKKSLWLSIDLLWIPVFDSECLLKQHWASLQVLKGVWTSCIFLPDEAPLSKIQYMQYALSLIRE